MRNSILIVTLSLILSGCGGSYIDSKIKYDNDLPKQDSNTKNTQKKSANNQAQSELDKVPQISQEEKERFLDAINSARADTQDCGEYGVFPPAPPLKWSDELYKAAYEHTQDMALNGIVEHDGTNSDTDWTAQKLKLGRGSHFYERIVNNGYYEYWIVEENVAGGTHFDNPEVVVQAWLDSPGHCKNLMNKDVKEVGMAHVKANTKYIHYWSQEFGLRDN